MPDLRRRFCLTSRSVTQSTPNRTPEEVIGLDGDQDRTRSECRTSRSPSPVLPVIPPLGNQDFPGIPPGKSITERRWLEIRVCERSHTHCPAVGPAQFRAKRTWRRIHSHPPSRQTGRRDGVRPRDERSYAQMSGATHGGAQALLRPYNRPAGAPWPKGGVPGQSGRTTRITSPPPSRGSAVIVPSCARATERTMDSPSPTPLSLPVRSVRSRRNGSKRFSTS